MNFSYNKSKIFVYFLFFISCLPFFFIANNNWDGVIYDYAFSINDFSIIEFWYEISRINFQLFLANGLYLISNNLNLPHDLIFDIFTSIAFILYVYEVNLFCKKTFNLDLEWQLILILFTIFIPLWHNATSINIGIYLFCFYLVFLSFRFILNSKYLIKTIGVALLLCSFSIKSNVFLICGLTFVFYFKKFKKNKKIQINNIILIVFTSILFVLVYLNFFKPYGIFENYNSVSIENLKTGKFLKNFQNFFSYIKIFFYILSLFIIYIIIFKKNEIKNLFMNENFENLVLSFILFLIAITPYILVDKSTFYSSVIGFKGRHALGIIVSLSLIFIFTIKTLNDFIINKKIIFSLIFFLITYNLYFSIKGFYYKYESSIIKLQLVETFKNLEKPRSGLIYLKNSNYHINQIEISHILFKAFNEASWVGAGAADVESLTKYDPMDLFEEDINMKKINIQTDVNETCETTYILKNNIKKNEKIKRIKNLFFQKEKYLVIDQTYLKC